MIEQPLRFASGNVVKNRIAKAAMSENMADSNFVPGPRFQTLYKRWSESGAGLLITGNVMVDRAHLGEPKNVVLDKDFRSYEELRNWAAAATASGTLTYVQLNHPGKQAPNFLVSTPVAPSAIGYTSQMRALFNPPRELSEAEIFEIIEQFANAAYLVKEAGFSGVQIHAAHGYLISQFLSPLHNQRTDQWGGSLENRMRFLLEIVRAVQARVGSNFGLAVKLNSADFQKGGFTQEESLEVVKALDALIIDFIEISGGSYESAAMIGSSQHGSMKREAYFLDFAQNVRRAVRTPIMVTGGFKTVAVMREAVDSGIDLIGVGRTMCVYPDLPNQILNNTIESVQLSPKRTGFSFIDKAMPLEIMWYTNQIHRLGRGLNTPPNHSVWFTIANAFCEMGASGLKRVRAS